MRVRAVQLREFGPPQVLLPVEVADPVAGTGQIVVDVAFASVTFVETQIRAGTPPNPSMLPSLPAILGNGVGGIVMEVGAGVEEALLGARVVTATGGSGGYAERVAVAADDVHIVPDTLPLDAAVALLADGRTAMGLVAVADLAAGETVLVEAAAGGVGSLLVQLAASAGARVIAVAGGPDKLALARSLGAEVTVDYGKPGWGDEVRRLAGAVNVVFDGVGGTVGQEGFRLLRHGGRFVAFGMASGSFADVAPSERPAVARLGLGAFTPDDLARLPREALDAAVAGRLHPVIGQRVPLPRAAEAHAAIEARATLGKTLLVTGTPESDAILRAETTADVGSVRAVNLAAFPTEHEADLVDALRDSDAWIPGLSWIAVVDREVVAYALLTRCSIDDTPSLALAPVAVTPAHQSRGLGAAVTKSALDTARSRGESSVVVLGHPEYYPRFGFTVASRHDIVTPFDVPDQALMALSLDGTPLPSGTVHYPPPFGV